MIIPLRDNAPSYTTPVVTLSLILVNFLVFGLQWLYPAGFAQSIMDWGEVPVRILAGQPIPGTNFSPAWTMLTSMFMHGGFLHIIFNMLALWLFGDNVEWLLGRAKYLLFYIACGLTASGFTIVFGYESEMPGVGASGAIAAVMGAYLLFFPRSRVVTFVPIFLFGWFANIPSAFYLGVWFVSQLLSGLVQLSTQQGVIAGGVAWWAHIGGFLFGLLFAKPFCAGRRLRREYVDEYFPW